MYTASLCTMKEVKGWNGGSQYDVILLIAHAL